MITRLGDRLGRVFRAAIPDPFVIALGLTLLTAVLAVLVGFQTGADKHRPDIGERALRVFDAWGGIANPSRGLWSLLAFTMQMCLVLVTGHAMASAPAMRALILRIACWPRRVHHAAAMVAMISCLAGVVNWGLGLIVGAILAREVAGSLRRRGLTPPSGLLPAAGYSALLVWHGGLSGSAPLSVTTIGNARKAFTDDQLASLNALVVDDKGAVAAAAPWIGLDATLGSALNLIVTGGLVVLVPSMYWLLAPRALSTRGSTVENGDARPAIGSRKIAPVPSETEPVPGRFPDWLERSPIPAWVLAALIAAVTVRFVARSGFGQLGLDQINGVMLAIGLALHGSLRRYADAAEDGVRGCTGIVLQFPLYAGIMEMMRASGLAHMLAASLTDLGTQRTAPVLSFVSAAIVNVFVPSGGGQWAIQGPIALDAGQALGIPPTRMVMSVAYGDQLTNMLQPFWALPLLAITGAKASEVVGYTAVVMVVAGVWIGGCLLLLG